MNVIGSRPDGWWRDRPKAMRRLVGSLDGLAAHGDRLTVVFDGRPCDLRPGPGVEVAFASRRGPNAADDDIAALVAADEDAAGLTVVTSDRTLAERVRGAGAEVVGAGEFRSRLEREHGVLDG